VSALRVFNRRAKSCAVTQFTDSPRRVIVPVIAFDARQRAFHRFRPSRAPPVAPRHFAVGGPAVVAPQLKPDPAASLYSRETKGFATTRLRTLAWTPKIVYSQ
jgi:hypothetical protein